MTQNTNYYGADYANYVIANPDGSGTYVNAGANPDLSQYDATAAPTSWGTRATGTFILTLKPPAAATLPPLVPTFLKTSATTPGTTIVMAYGTARLGSQVIWGTSIEAAGDGSTSYATFMAAFCEPADWTEPLRVQKLWANGTLFYDFDAGGAVAVANLSAADQAALAASVAGMTVHLGGPGELPDPTMEEAVGAGNAPANRGLRTIVFPDFPLAISNNDFPAISCLFKRTDTTLISVQTAVEKIVQRYAYRTGAAITIDVEGIPDECYGVTLSDSGSMLDVLIRHKDIYNYQIIDGDPIRIVRREVTSDLVIDLEVTEAECLRAGSTPAVQMSRKDPASFPALVTFQYIDPDANFDVRVQQALHEGAQTSTSAISVQSAFITDANTTRSLAFDILYQQRAKGLNLTFELDNIEPEVSNIIQLTMTEGDSYTLLVQQQTHTKARSAGISALALLTAGADVAGDSGHDGGGLGGRLWPEKTTDGIGVVAVNSSRIWSTGFFTYMMSYNSTASPRRRIRTFLDNLSSLDLTGTWGNNDTLESILLDANYAYYVSGSNTILTRVPIDGTFAQREDLKITEGMYPIGGVASVYIGPNTEPGFFLIRYRMPAAIHGNKMYIAFCGTWNSDIDKAKLVVIDLLAWDAATGVDVYDFETLPLAIGTGIFTYATDLVITDNGTICILCAMAGGTYVAGDHSRIYYSTVASPGSFSHLSLDYGIGYGCAISNKVYAYENLYRPQVFGGTNHKGTHLVIADFSGSPSASYVDITDDPNCSCFAMAPDREIKPWTDGSKLYFYANRTVAAASGTNFPSDAAHKDFSSEHPYIARRNLDGTADGGAFIKDLLPWEWELEPQSFPVFFGGKHYIMLRSFGYLYRIMMVEQDLSAATLYPRATTTTPANDRFENATIITLGQTKTGSPYYASFETGEPYGPSPAWDSTYYAYFKPEHGVWFVFHAPATTTYTISIADQHGTDTFDVWVVTGDDVTALTDVANHLHAGSFGAGTISLSATAGVNYYIRVSCFPIAGDPPGNSYSLSIS